MNRVRGEWFTITKEIAEVIEKFSIAIVEPTEDTEQTVDLERERLNAFVFPYVVRQVKIAAATRGVTLGEVIEELVIRHLPPVPGPEAAR